MYLFWRRITKICTSEKTSHTVFILLMNYFITVIAVNDFFKNIRNLFPHDILPLQIKLYAFLASFPEPQGLNFNQT